MKTVFLLFDSLNRSALGAYGGHHLTPNFDRLASHSIVFDNHFAGSLPCMPARRDMHTGRLNFLHRSWGPLEPFDDSFPGQLKQADIYSHLISDHYHYFEDGGSTYHTRYSTCHLSGARNQTHGLLWSNHHWNVFEKPIIRFNMKTKETATDFRG